MQSDCWFYHIGISNLVIAHAVRNVRKLAVLKLYIRTTRQVTLVSRYISTLTNVSLQNLHPASVTRVVMNGAKFAWIPTQHEKRIRLIICGNQVAGVMTARIKQSVLFIIVSGKASTTL
jgi:hypothetical protein